MVGLFERSHSECRRIHQAGWEQMVSLATQAARSRDFSESALRKSLSDIAHRSYAGVREIEEALEEGWNQGVAHAMTDATITREEEDRLRAFRDTLALETEKADPKALEHLERALSDRLILEARLAAIAIRPGDDHLRDLADSLNAAGLQGNEKKRLLVQAWETAGEASLEDNLLSLDEENALFKYADHFGLTQQDLDGNGAQTTLVQAAVIRDVTMGNIPQHQNVQGRLPIHNNRKTQQRLLRIFANRSCSGPVCVVPLAAGHFFSYLQTHLQSGCLPAPRM